MCTGFVHKGKDRICGFNMDLPDGMLDWKLIMDQECFYVGLRPAFRPELLPEGMKDAPEEYMPCKGEYLRIHGVNRNGNFGNQLNALGFTRAPFQISGDSVPLYSLVDRFLAGRSGLNEIAETARTKHIVNMPGEAGMPDPACHSLLSDRAGRILIIEPGNGFAEIRENYAVMSNFPMLILPGDLTPEKYGYYGMDRYETALNMIGKAGEGFTTEDALAVLDAVKQVQWAPTQVSFVYSQNENRVYYTLQHDFNHIRIHQF